ncbi:CpsD/CapB family tyrosine-protein kinase [Paenibacillus melissococcoides]|uniref:non-specific protein-tyrosine kinase n=1 Tax=Paenibacillus melissococcoides TaxID=2912268 RepID=A0ABM9G0E3_9BACL|nr:MULTISPECIES: CpsD/CapB family tyrosine-protein kinase [Paenibacillus]MEB9897676.1 CpsD/CapB family tyrosine-protein kinase [Bacillus cereus]CAH8244788.1 CpsD/CapB family tyrosine-protein kinase [Paenibacillus melissococcoides]CAH8708976.1 CpsD/CapB family tyrosine-protein kinase [Paenibacillus melissococcoides]CAH8709730.1 CpsD/CapB family tyrosine-protein kinase [Paenibacillus melissococcoides]
MAHKQNRSNPILVDYSTITYHHASSTQADQYRVLRNNIRFAVTDAPFASVAVTSPRPGNGTTTVAVNLSIAFAQRGDRVLLIDANVRRPAIHRILNVKASPGLAEAVGQRAVIQEVIQETPIENLCVISSGSAVTELLDLCDSSFMDQLELTQDFDIVLVDCPSVLSASEASVLASGCRAALLVIENGRTSAEDALEAKRLLEFGHARIAGTFFNKK